MGEADTLEESPGSIVPVLAIAAGLLVAIILMFYIMGEINNQIETTLNNESYPIEFKGPPAPIVIIFVLGGAGLGIVLLLFGPSNAEETAEEIAEAKTIKNYTREERKTRKTALQIIRERYAKGEITKEEYTEFMARL